MIPVKRKSDRYFFQSFLRNSNTGNIMAVTTEGCGNQLCEVQKVRKSEDIKKKLKVYYGNWLLLKLLQG